MLSRDMDVEDLARRRERARGSFYVKAAAAEDLRRREGLGRGLTRAGAHVVDARPEELTAALVNGYLEIEARSRP